VSHTYPLPDRLHAGLDFLSVVEEFFTRDPFDARRFVIQAQEGRTR
jgi:hypothetical protein